MRIRKKAYSLAIINKPPHNGQNLCKKTALFILFFLISVLTIIPVTAQDGLELTAREREFLSSHPVLKVGNEDDWPPFDFSEHGVPKGYAIEHLELIGEKLGISFEYVNGYSWHELKQLFRQGKIDVLPSLWISEKRKEYMVFTEPYLTLPYVIIAGKNDNSINSFQDLYGKTVATVKGYKQEEVLNNSFPGISQYQAENPLEGLKAISYGKADAYIGYRGVVDYLIATRFFTDLAIIGETNTPELGPQGLYIAVRPELSLLRGIFQKAMDSIARKKKVQLAAKWITVDKKPLPNLTAEEAAFIQNNKTLKVDNLQNWAPFNFNENGKPKGFCVDYVSLLADKLGVNIEFVTGPTWNEFLTMLKNGKLDLLCDVVETEKRRTYISFTKPYFTIFSGIVVKKKNNDITNLKDLRNKKVVIPQGFYYEDILNTHYPHLQVETKDTLLQCLKAVSAGNADAALAEKPVSDYLISSHFLTGLTSVPIVDSTHFENTPVAIGASTDKPILRTIFQKAMDAVTEAEMSEIYERWFKKDQLEKQKARIPLSPEEQLYLQQKETIYMSIHPNRLPFEALNKNGEHIGIVADIIDVVSERIGVPIRLFPTQTWKESLTAVKNGKSDILTCVHKNPDQMESVIFSKPYFSSVSVIAARDDHPYISDMNVLEGKKVAVPKENPITRYLNNNFSEIKLQKVFNLSVALDAVAKGRADAAVGNLQTISYNIHEKGLYNVKIAGQTPYKDFLRIGISKENKELQPILNKALDSITQQEINKITQKWLTIRYEHGFNYSLLWKILAGAAVIIAVIILWNRKLAALNRKLSQAHKDLARKSAELERLSITERLTGLYNRMKLEDILEYECKKASRSYQPLTIIMLDVDYFKNINDTYGHHIGDDVLCEFAAYLDDNTRFIDTVGRWGGEEFLIICPGTDTEGGRVFAEKLRKGIENMEFTVKEKITSSFGIAAYREGDISDDLFIRADKALYQAKEKGRNRVEVSQE